MSDDRRLVEQVTVRQKRPPDTYAFEARDRYFQDLYNVPNLAVMGRNTNYFPNDPRVKRALIEAIEREAYHDYAPPYGLEELQQLILAELRVPDLYAWVTDGATEGLFQITHMLLRPQDEFVTSDPGYTVTNNFAARAGARVIEVPIYDPTCGYRLSPARLREYVSERTRLIYVVDPLNPLGSCLTEAEVGEVCALAREVGAIVVHDCTYRDFADRHFPAVRVAPEHAIALYSFSKSAGLAGLRLGAVVAHPALIEELTRAQVNNLGSSLVAQLGAIVALRTKAEWLPRVLDAHREHMATLHDFLQRFDGFGIPVYPSQANFLAVDSSEAGYHAEYLASELLKRDVQVRQGSYNTRRFGEKFFRVGTTVPDEWIGRFCRAFEAIVRAGPPKDFRPERSLF